MRTVALLYEVLVKGVHLLFWYGQVRIFHETLTNSFYTYGIQEYGRWQNLSQRVCVWFSQARSRQCCAPFIAVVQGM